VLVTLVRRAKMAEPIKMPFGSDLGGPKKSCIKWRSRSRKGRGNFGGCPANWKVWELLLRRFRQQEKLILATMGRR